MPEESTTWERIKEAAKTIFRTGSDDKQAGIGLQRPVTKEMESYDRAAIKQDRRSMITECTKMIALDPRAARIVRKMASDAVVGNFTFAIQSSQSEGMAQQADQAIQGVIDRCEVLPKLKGWITSMLRDGDLFWEVVVDDTARKIVRLKKLAAIITMSNMNSEGNFPEDKPAYYQEHPWSRQEIKTFEAWQIVQLKFQEEDGKPYGTPLLAASRLAYERLDKGEKNIVARRAVKAGLSRHHRIGTPEIPGEWADIEEYKDRNKDTLENPFDPVKDWFSNGLVQITELTGDTALGDMEDIMYFAGQLPLNAGVPVALLSGGWEKSINRDVLGEQQEDYYKVIDELNGIMEAGLRKVFDFSLLLAGVNIEAIKYIINWGSKDRDDVKDKIERGKELQALGLSFETVLRICDLDGVVYEEELERIKKQIEDGIIPYGVNMKLDPNIMMLLGMIGAAGGAKTEALMEQIDKLRTAAESQFGGGSVDTMKKVLALAKRGR